MGQAGCQFSYVLTVLGLLMVFALLLRFAWRCATSDPNCVESGSMKPLFALLLIPLLGCNGIVSFQTGFLSNGFQTVSGVVSIVQITTIFANDGTKTIVTIVTFLALLPPLLSAAALLIAS